MQTPRGMELPGVGYSCAAPVRVHSGEQGSEAGMVSDAYLRDAYLRDVYVE